MYDRAYLVGSLFWLAVWALFFVLLPTGRRTLWWTGLVFAGAGPVSELWFLRDYWHPTYVFEVSIGTWRFGIEDYLCTFALAGIPAGIFEALARRRGMGALPPMRWGLFGRMLGWGCVGLALMAILTFGLGLGSIHALILCVALTALVMLAGRPGMLGLAVWAGLATGLLYWLFFVLFYLPLYPRILVDVWNPAATWGIHVGGVPVEEVLWLVAGGMFTGPVYRVCAAMPAGQRAGVTQTSNELPSSGGTSPPPRA